jgi:hypothetical protein
MNCSNAGTRTPIAGARNQCPTVRRHSIYIVYYTLYMSSIQGVRGGKNEIMNFVGATFKSPVFVLPARRKWDLLL